MKQAALIITLALFIFPVITLAQTDSLTPFLTAGDPGNGGIANLVNNLYALSITLAALLAVIKIIIGGVKWMMSDIVTEKSEAKKEIRTALLGLLIVISAVVVLTVINPQTANINFNLVQIPAATLPVFVGPIELAPGEIMESVDCKGTPQWSDINATDCTEATQKCIDDGGTPTEKENGRSVDCLLPAPPTTAPNEGIPCRDAGGTTGWTCIEAHAECLAKEPPGVPFPAADKKTLACTFPEPTTKDFIYACKAKNSCSEVGWLCAGNDGEWKINFGAETITCTLPVSSPGLPGTPEIPPEQPGQPQPPGPEILSQPMTCNDPKDLAVGSCAVEMANCAEDYKNGRFELVTPPKSNTLLLPETNAIVGTGLCKYDE